MAFILSAIIDNLTATIVLITILQKVVNERDTRLWFAGLIIVAANAGGKTGDGAGILIDIPHDFLKEVCSFTLPAPKTYALGMVFLPQKLNQRTRCVAIFEEELSRQNLSIIGWRDVPTNVDVVGKIANQTLPNIKQVFVEDATGTLTEDQLNTKSFIARKRAEHRVFSSKMSQNQYFYLPSFSTRTVIYKGLLMPEDIEGFYMDLKDPRVVTRLALVHQRFSTNTFPTWDLAQPFRFMCHNGEINTYRGNVIRMKAREELFANEFFGEEMKFCISDGGNFDGTYFAQESMKVSTMFILSKVIVSMFM